MSPPTIAVDEALSDFLALPSEDQAEVIGLIVLYNRMTWTDRDRREAAELYPLDGPVPCTADAAVRRRRLAARQDRRWRRFCASQATRPHQARPPVRAPRAHRRASHQARTTNGPPGDDDGEADPAQKRTDRSRGVR